nr:protein Niban 3 isoform X6 [Manis javanica]
MVSAAPWPLTGIPSPTVPPAKEPGAGGKKQGCLLCSQSPGRLQHNGWEALEPPGQESAAVPEGPGGHSAEELPALLPWAAGSLCPEEDLPRAGPPGASQVPAAAQQKAAPSLRAPRAPDPAAGPASPVAASLLCPAWGWPPGVVQPQGGDQTQEEPESLLETPMNFPLFLQHPFRRHLCFSAATRKAQRAWRLALQGGIRLRGTVLQRSQAPAARAFLDAVRLHRQHQGHCGEDDVTLGSDAEVSAARGRTQDPQDSFPPGAKPTVCCPAGADRGADAGAAALAASPDPARRAGCRPHPGLGLHRGSGETRRGRGGPRWTGMKAGPEWSPRLSTSLSLCPAPPTPIPSRLCPGLLALVGSTRPVRAAPGRSPRCRLGRGFCGSPGLPTGKGRSACGPGEDSPHGRGPDAATADARGREAAGQGSGPPGILPAQEGRHTATPDHEDTGEQCGSLNHSGADPSHPGHGPPVLPPAWEPLRHPAAQGGLFIWRDALGPRADADLLPRGCSEPGAPGAAGSTVRLLWNTKPGVWGPGSHTAAHGQCRGHLPATGRPGSNYGRGLRPGCPAAGESQGACAEGEVLWEDLAVGLVAQMVTGPATVCVVQKFHSDSGSAQRRFLRGWLLCIFLPFVLNQLQPSCKMELPEFEGDVLAVGSPALTTEGIYRDVVQGVLLQRIDRELENALGASDIPCTLDGCSEAPWDQVGADEETEAQKGTCPRHPGSSTQV